MIKASLEPVALGMTEEQLRPIPNKGGAEMIRKVYEVDPMACPHYPLFFLGLEARLISGSFADRSGLSISSARPSGA